jgi:periplasmic copper chaperone A
VRDRQILTRPPYACRPVKQTSERTSMRRTLLLLLPVAGLALPAAAQAHISIHPNAVPVGANATLDIRVPNESDNARTTKLAVAFPPGFIDVATQPPPGWSSRVVTAKLAQPVKTDSGTVDTRVSEVVWTAPAGGGIPPGQFANFPISVLVPGRAGQVLTFKAVQTYSNGQVARWIGPPSADQPAPTIDLTNKGGVLQDVAGGEAGPGPLPAGGAGAAAAPAQRTTVVEHTSSSNGLAIAALVVGLLGLLLGGGALMTARRNRARETAVG